MRVRSGSRGNGARTDVYGSVRTALQQPPATQGRAAPRASSAARRKPVRARRRPPPASSVYGRLRVRLDIASWRPALRPDIEIAEFPLRWGNDYAMLADTRQQVHFRVDAEDATLLRLLDGTRSVDEIVMQRLRDSGDLDAPALADLIRTLYEAGFLVQRFEDVAGAVKRALDPVSPARQKLRTFIKTLSVEWAGADRLVRFLYAKGIRLAFHPLVAAGLGVLSIAGFVAFVAVARSGRFTLSGPSPAAEALVLLVMNYFLTFVHELGHAVVLTHNGRAVRSAGFMLYFGSPAFFVDSSDGLMMSRKQRILQSFAGPFAESILAGGAAVFALIFPESAAAPTLYKFAALNYFLVFLNLIPLLELDGYWILSDAIQVPDLRPRSLEFVRNDLLDRIRRRARLTPQEVGLAAYGLLGVVFTVFVVWGSSVWWWRIFGDIVSSLWHGGVVSRMLLLVLALFLGGPVFRSAIGAARWLYRRGRLWVRAIRFRLETSWRVEAAELIDALPIFDGLPTEVLDDLAGRVRLRAARRGEHVVRQGDRATTFYVVRRGSLEVVEQDASSGKERRIATLGRGESFGELGVATAAPRAATVRALEDAELFEIDKGTFDRLLASMVDVPSFEPTLQRIEELRALPAFARMEPGERAELLKHGEWVNIAPGETFIRKGEQADAFYAIASGQVEVLAGRSVVATFGPGDHVGEAALVMGTERTATVRARTPVRAFRLSKRGFDRLLRRMFSRGTLKPHVAVERNWKH